MGGISVSENVPLFVEHHDGSVAAVYWVEDTDDTRSAARGLIDTFTASGVPTPMLVVVDYSRTLVVPIPLNLLGLRKDEA